MYKARLNLTFGFGLECKYFSANSYKELIEKTDKYIAEINHKMILNYDRWLEPLECICESITYFYPSGKHYKKKLFVSGS